MHEQCETRNRPFLQAWNPERGMMVLFRPRCKMWGCPACAKINTKLWAMRTKYGADHFHSVGRQLRFLTLTSHEKLDRDTSLKIWPKAWKKLHTRANREGGHGAYVMIPERHKDGRLHMHALVTWPHGTRWWKNNARECGLGFMAESDIIRHSGGAAMYVTKYLHKTLGDETWPAGWRRVRPSRDWPKMPDPEQPGGWTFRKINDGEQLDELVLRHVWNGTRVLVLDHITAWEAIAAIDNEGVFVR